MKKNISERDIAVLMADRYTRDEAVSSLELGTMVYEDLEQMARDYETTIDEIRKGTVEDLRIVICDGTEYGIAVVH